MATISNANVGPAGQVISSTAVDAKFTDVATATATLDVNNVRSEGVDRRTLATSRAEPLAHMSYISVASAGTATGQTGESAFSLGTSGLRLSPPSGLTLKAGDLLRINFTVRLESHNNQHYVPMLDQPQTPFPLAPTLSIGLLFFPVWRTAGAGAYSVLPSQAVMDNTVSAPSFIPFNDTNLRTDSAAWCSMEGIESGSNRICKNTVHGAFYYKHTGSDLVVDHVQINGRGPVAYEWDTGTSAKVIRVPDWGAIPYSSGGANWPTSWTLVLGAGQLSMMVIRGDS